MAEIDLENHEPALEGDQKHLWRHASLQRSLQAGK